MMKWLQKLGKALMLPVAALPVCGILMGIGYALAPAVMGAEGATTGAAYTIGFLLVKAGGALIDNMAWLFAIGAAVGLADILLRQALRCDRYRSDLHRSICCSAVRLAFDLRRSGRNRQRHRWHGRHRRWHLRLPEPSAHPHRPAPRSEQRVLVRYHRSGRPDPLLGR